MAVKKPTIVEVAKLIKAGMAEAEKSGKEMEVREIIEKCGQAYAIAISVDNLIEKYDLNAREARQYYHRMFGENLDAYADAAQELMKDFKLHLKKEKESGTLSDAGDERFSS